MSIFFNNWLEEGYYEWDDYFGYTRVEGEKIEESLEKGNLYYSDGSGYGVAKVDEINES